MSITPCKALPLAMAAFALLEAGCSVAAGPAPRPAADTLPAAAVENQPPAQGRRGGQVPMATSDRETLAALIAAVRADAQRSGAGAGAAVLRVDATEATWADGAMGCPVPGQMVTQALIPGWRLDVRGPGVEAVYHASRRGQWLWCPPGRSQAPRSGSVAQ